MNNDMKVLASRIAAIRWTDVAEVLHGQGFALVPGLLSDDQCAELRDGYDNPAAYRKKVVMERYHFGLGEYRYFDYPLPQLVQFLRETIYEQLAPIANSWMKALHTDQQFPAEHAVFLQQCRDSNQLKATPLILKYGPGGFNTLHQDLYGDTWFPMQAVLFLSEPDEDYTGGAFVLTEQVPRAQSKAIVLQPRKGDLLIFTTNFRPVKGSKGYYRANMKHGVSEVHSGERYTLGIPFHDAVS